MKEAKSQLFFDKNHADIHEITDGSIDQPNVLRVFDGMGKSIQIQIRTYKPIIRFSKTAKPRKMIATVSVSIEELEQILEYAKENKHA